MDSIITNQIVPAGTSFLTDVLQGLQSKPKFLSSKYFYDEKGDRIFQQIMDMDEYYLTDAEMEIMEQQSSELARFIAVDNQPFDLIELGAGDATKSIHLLNALLKQQLTFTYFPIDISTHVINDLEENLPKKLPQLKMEGLNGDYFKMLKKAKEISSRRKVVLFMGANIGNMNLTDAEQFCCDLRNELSQNDLLIIGFDLKKNPKQILAAYNDSAGITRSFNLNLLDRINNELDGDFDVSKFDHYASYDPETGACKSYLISLQEQWVNVGDETIHFDANEFIYMEISQKYSLEDVDALAKKSGFNPIHRFFDHQEYFTDAVWKVD